MAATIDPAWLERHLAYLQGLRAPSEAQRLLMVLAQKPRRTPEEERQLAVLVRAEQAAERARKARAEAGRVVSAARQAERKARAHALFQTAGLLILAGLVDSARGTPRWDRAELLGALIELTQTGADDPRRARWRHAGEALLAERSKAQQRKAGGKGELDEGDLVV